MLIKFFFWIMESCLLQEPMRHFIKRCQLIGIWFPSKKEGKQNERNHGCYAAYVYGKKGYSHFNRSRNYSRSCCSRAFFSKWLFNFKGCFRDTAICINPANLYCKTAWVH